MFCFREKSWLHHDYLIILVSNEIDWNSDELGYYLGRFGLGIAIAGGVINSMLYNGKK